MLLAPGSLRQETSGDTGSRPSSPECARQTMPGAPERTPQKHAPGRRRTPNTTRSAASETCGPEERQPLGQSATPRPATDSAAHPRLPGPRGKLGGGEGRPGWAGTLASGLPCLGHCQPAGTFLCPWCGPRGRQGWISPKGSGPTASAKGLSNGDQETGALTGHAARQGLSSSEDVSLLP